jgi:bacterioferritin
MSEFGLAKHEIGVFRVDKTNEIIAELKKSYAGEFETLQNYVAHAVDLAGTRPEIVRASLAASISQKLRNVRRLALRINLLGGRVPGSLELPRAQNYLQPTPESPDVLTVIHGILRASEAAIARYETIIAATEGNDYLTQDLVIDLLAQERDQHQLFTRLLENMDV